MRKYSRFIVVGAAVAALAVPSAAMADQPTVEAGNTSALASTMTLQQWVDGGYGSAVAYYSSRAIHNGTGIGGVSSDGARGQEIQAIVH
jgi:hypothetical protein